MSANIANSPDGDRLSRRAGSLRATLLRMLEAFALDPAVVHLNHGSFGACPRAALAVQSAWRARMEAATMRFYVVEWRPALDEARAAVARFVGADPGGLAFVPNATTAVATALDALVGEGDEIVTTDHAYAACRNALDRVARTRGATVVTAHVPFPLTDPHAPTERILAAVTPHTRAVLLDHISSPTALVLDVATISRELSARGVHVIVDGAHAAGTLDLDLARLPGVAVYTSNLHKWPCAPKGVAFLHVRDDLRDTIRPLVTSHGATCAPPERFLAEHDWTGTHDPSGYLAAPAAIEELARLGGDWPSLRARNHALALQMRDVLLERLGGTPPAPDALLGAMASIPVTLPEPPRAFERRLLETGWEVAIADWTPLAATYIRVSAHVYNTLDDARRLADHLHALGVRGS